MLDRMSAQYCLDKAAECDRKALEARDPDATKTCLLPRSGVLQPQTAISPTKSRIFCVASARNSGPAKSSCPTAEARDEALSRTRDLGA
jgi:hypothetical protein